MSFAFKRWTTLPTSTKESSYLHTPKNLICMRQNVVTSSTINAYRSGATPKANALLTTQSSDYDHFHHRYLNTTILTSHYF